MKINKFLPQRILVILVSICSSISLNILAQTTEKMSFQSVVRNQTGKILSNTPIGIKLSILQKDMTVFSETHQKSTNVNGLLTLEIGSGNLVLGDLNKIDWSLGSYNLKSELDISGGTNYSITNTTEFLTVPYAMFSKSAGNGYSRISQKGDTMFLVNGNFLIIPGISSSNPTKMSTYGQNIIDIEGNVYKTVNIGTQQWMMENLKSTKYNDGSSILNVTDNTIWSKTTSPAWCYYNNDATKNTNHGKLYNWFAVSTTTNGNKNICPSGWHVPKDAEWKTLINYLGGNFFAGGKMKQEGTTNWQSPNYYATNLSLFTALASGCRDFYNGVFTYFGTYTYWWSSDEQDASSGNSLLLYNTIPGSIFGGVTKKMGYSVRCIKD